MCVIAVLHEFLSFQYILLCIYVIFQVYLVKLNVYTPRGLTILLPRFTTQTRNKFTPCYRSKISQKEFSKLLFQAKGN